MHVTTNRSVQNRQCNSIECLSLRQKLSIVLLAKHIQYCQICCRLSSSHSMLSKRNWIMILYLFTMDTTQHPAVLLSPSPDQTLRNYRSIKPRRNTCLLSSSLITYWQVVASTQLWARNPRVTYRWVEPFVNLLTYSICSHTYNNYNNYISRDNYFKWISNDGAASAATQKFVQDIALAEWVSSRRSCKFLGPFDPNRETLGYLMQSAGNQWATPEAVMKWWML